MPRHYPQKTSLTLEPHQVIIKPLVTEKGVHRSTRSNAYTFQISRLATKQDVRQAVETLFNVKVEKVATQNRKGKPRRTKFGFSHTADWKKAIVTLHEDSRIDFF
ncbi:50S ribosomal protein L23 [Botrimarina hoheduenensis]|uniref:Large ribosomal subunit protein uL23 n=1 Tax=Botrimarina hoheduenensis TaxID=2528000 RepID=A0A5C5W6Q4_9BACT|nr:50S ribosomal protein L23 [Botrimarina hoheduenensis]TWT46598.1 50S ribosomal protein L23 [Botrimarina hoheduenensis]